MIITCYEVWFDEEDGDYYAQVFNYDREKGKVIHDIETMAEFSSVEATKTAVEMKYSDAICVHCG